MSESNSRSHCSVALVIFIAMCTGWSMPAFAVNSPSLLPPPTVLNVAPSNGAILRCPTMTNISAVFSTSMDPVSINSSTFTVTGSGGVNVPGTVTYRVATNVAVFSPSVELATNTMYSATITTGVADIANKPLSENLEWSFTVSSGCAPPVPRM